MAQTWVLVANSSEARIFKMDRNGKTLDLLDTIDHPESRKKAAELVSDRPGHYQGDTTGSAHGAFSEPTNPKTHEQERFAMELAGLLDHGRTANRYGRLVVVSSPRFKGLLNKHLNKGVSRLIWDQIDKDYTQLPERDLLQRIAPQIRREVQ